jgi:hypothetical protein
MRFQGYEKQFNKQPLSEIEIYCKNEGVSLLLIRESNENRDDTKKLGCISIGYTVSKQWLLLLIKRIIMIYNIRVSKDTN